ncbi:MAG TPA: hypothetical protein VFY56_15485, partial [Propionibacteriaceae bacterium]|nr:hypothetical protein [Propionibacteriaceae bacterium]
MGAVTALCLSAAACTPTGLSTPTTSPTPSASPTETKLERQTRLDFEAAEKAYRTFNAEYVRLARAGGAKQPSQLLKDTASGPYLTDAATALRQQYQAKARSTGEFEIGYVHSGTYSPQELTLNTCEDGSAIRIYNRAGKLLGTGTAGTKTVHVRQLDG